MTVQVTFEVDEASKARLEASAARRGESLGQYVAACMTEVLDREPADAETDVDPVIDTYDAATRLDMREAWIAAIRVGLDSARDGDLIPHDQVVAQAQARWRAYGL